MPRKHNFFPKREKAVVLRLRLAAPRLLLTMPMIVYGYFSFLDQPRKLIIMDDQITLLLLFLVPTVLSVGSIRPTALKIGNRGVLRISKTKRKNAETFAETLQVLRVGPSLKYYVTKKKKIN